MINDDLNKNDKESLIFLIANISPTVADDLQRENYRNRADSDGSTIDFILEDVFHKLMTDVQTIGLDLHVDMSDYVDDSEKLGKLIHILQYILPASLYPKIKSESNIRELIEHIVSGTLDGDSTVIATYLNELGGLDSGIPILEDTTDLIDELYMTTTQTPTFTDYLSNLIDLYHTEVVAKDHDADRHTDYRNVLKDFIGDLSDAVNVFENTYEYNDLVNKQSFVIYDLTSHDNFTEYSYLFLESHHTLPTELTAGYDRKWFYYEVSHPWCLKYYEIRHLTNTISKDWYMFMVCFAYALSRGDMNVFKTKFGEIEKLNPESKNTYFRILNTLGKSDV